MGIGSTFRSQLVAALDQKLTPMSGGQIEGALTRYGGSRECVRSERPVLPGPSCAGPSQQLARLSHPAQASEWSTAPLKRKRAL